jgi:hypothetical protein
VTAPLDIARSYIALGWAPIPIPFRQKRPVLDDWEHLRITTETAAKHWNGVPANVGVILGDASHGLADVDLDCPEARELAPRILPATRTFGRATNPESHWLYVALGATTKQFKDHGTMLVELRATAPRTGNGQQTVFPGSTHKDTGEPIEWTLGCPEAPVEISPDELRQLVTHLAIACLLKRHHPDLLESYLAAPSGNLPEDIMPEVRDWLGLKPAPKPAAARPSRSLEDYGSARARFNADHPLSAANHGSACPAEGCEGKNSFKGDESKATCFHSSHPDKCGTRIQGGTECFVFDPLDLESFQAGRSQSDHLQAEGYWSPRLAIEEPPPLTDDDFHQWYTGRPATDSERDPGSDDVTDADREAYTHRVQEAHARFAPKTDIEITQALNDLRKRQGTSGVKRLAFTDWADLRRKQFSKPVWLIKGILPSQGVAAISGEPKSNKTWVLLESAVALATATPMFGQFVVPERKAVALVLTEDDEQNVRNRIRSLLEGRGLSQDAADGWIFLITRAELNLLNESSVADLIAACRRLPRTIALLGLDPLRNLHAGDENDSTEMIKVMAQMRALRDVLSCAVDFNHHAIKSSKDTSDRRPGQKMRGSGAIHGAVDAGLYLSNTETDGREHWSNRIDVEIKGARGAGFFDLHLHVEDDENDEACFSKWTVEGADPSDRSAKETAAAAAKEEAKAAREAEKHDRAERDHEDLVAKIVSLLCEHGTLGREALKAKSRSGTTKVAYALEDAKLRGLIEPAIEGKKIVGWKLPNTTKTPIPPDPARSRPETAIFNFQAGGRAVGIPDPGSRPTDPSRGPGGGRGGMPSGSISETGGSETDGSRPEISKTTETRAGSGSGSQFSDEERARLRQLAHTDPEQQAKAESDALAKTRAFNDGPAPPHADAEAIRQRVLAESDQQEQEDPG